MVMSPDPSEVCVLATISSASSTPTVEFYIIRCPRPPNTALGSDDFLFGANIKIAIVDRASGDSQFCFAS